VKYTKEYTYILWEKEHTKSYTIYGIFISSSSSFKQMWWCL